MNKKVEYETFKGEAANNCARSVLEMLKKL